MRHFIMVLIIIFTCVDSLGSSIRGADWVQQVKEFSYEGHRDRQVHRAFIKEIRRRLVVARPNRYFPPLSTIRVNEIILSIETVVGYVNDMAKDMDWYTGHPITEKEVHESVATANMYRNVLAQQSWEGEPNLGYMDIRATTALNALWDLGITTIYRHEVPQTLKAYEEDREFQVWWKTLLMTDLPTNFLTGTWTLCKGKNWAEGSFNKFVAYYTMGKRSYYRQLKKSPVSRGLSKIAQIHVTRWEGIHLVWADVDKDVPPS